MKYVVITGGVVSGLGKGITSSSIGVLLKASGLTVTCIKVDPYLNIDAGTMSPYEHGEVFVLDDGGEADLDLGNYERFLDISLTRDHNITTGKIYQHVLSKERVGKYLGKTVQVVPHITDAIMEWIITVAQVPVDGSKQVPDVCLIELGGTVGDIESMIFLEALRQLRYKVGKDNFCLVHVSLVPVVSAVGEPKTKPTQHGVRELMRAFLEPDILVCRSSKPLSRDIINKLATSCMVPSDNVVGVHDVSNIYKVPLLLLEQRMPSLILRALSINKSPCDAIPKWVALAHRAEHASKEVIIGFVGKYNGLADSYLSVTHALTHAAIEADCKLTLSWIDSAHLEDETKVSSPEQWNAAWAALRAAHGVLIPGGFGDRGVNGKILAAQYARTKQVPFLGICLGLQVAVIEFARNVCGLEGAHSTELNPDTPEPVVFFMPEGSKEIKGGTMRLGTRRATVREQSLCSQLYEYQPFIHERHRHRYEVNPAYIKQLESAGLIFSGIDDAKERMECIELPEDVHPFFFALQAHPEFKSRPLHTSPPFRGFIQAAAGKFVRRKAAATPSRKSSSATAPDASFFAPSSSSSASSAIAGATSSSRTFFSTPAPGLFPDECKESSAAVLDRVAATPPPSELPVPAPKTPAPVSVPAPTTPTAAYAAPSPSPKA